ncbi:uncharacterized protein LOC124210016 isoform X1 [Daphnia pulex]|uniref:uncharacterized protein LOC124210016 isoform X1 n=1 Tax=Daphnia pulex TaxID=6669 RepID=UPI001EDCCF0E|nr:uncharacterized protein LOC124210016 isoform X1 [Daphnia pulex]
MDYYLNHWIRMFTVKRRRKKCFSQRRIMSILPILFCSLGVLVTETRAQCFGGVETYEKTARVAFTSVSNLQGLVSQPGTAVTRDCAALCKQTATCAAFTVDYSTSRCQSIDIDDVKRKDHLKDVAGVNYFEKICLRLNNFNSICGDRLWAFERVIGASLQGFDDMEQKSVQSRSDCQRLCLEQTNFVCRSAEYDESEQTCRMSREDRRTQPLAFRRDAGSWDYLENQCVKTLPDCRYAGRPDGSLTVSMDQVEFAQSQGECESLCDQARVFTCRAYSFTADENRCYLSGDDSISQSSPTVSQLDGKILTPSGSSKKSTVYAEKLCSISQCENGIFTFEKVTGHFLRSARQDMINRGKFLDTSSRTGDPAGGGITVECGRTCLEMGGDCPAYSVDYAQGRCFKLDRNSQGRAQELTIREGMSYFEKICLRGNVGPCRDRAWAFERYPGKELRGMEERVIPLVATRRDCEELCLRESRSVCRSARYDTMTLECRLSSSDKRLRPEAFVDAPSQVEYLENQCVSLGNTMCSYQTVVDMYPRYLDSLVANISDDQQCQHQCSNNRAFACRAYSFYASGSQCFISSDDRISGGPSALLSRPGTNYTERSCSKRATIDEINKRNDSSASFFAGEGGFGGLSDIGVMPDFMPADTPVNTGIVRFPSAAAADVNSGNNRFPSFGSFGGDSIDRLPAKNNPPIRISPISKCRSGRPHYQKVTGYEAVTSRFMSLRPATPAAIERTGVLIDCLDKCNIDELCSGINYNSIKQTCVGIESADGSDSSDSFVQLPLSRSNGSDNFLLRPNSGFGYFESLCLQAVGCESVWSTERTPGYFMRGVEQEIIRGISRLRCTERCLDERRFVCRSASYDTNRKECYLSPDDRYTKPRAFQSNPIYDYIENQCSPSDSRLCRYAPLQPDRYLLYADRMVSGTSQTAASCQTACDSERHFRCRSFSVYVVLGLMQCSMSSSASPAYEIQRGSQSSEKECSTVINNEIPVQLETAHLGLGGNNRGNRILPGTTGVIPPGGDPGGWVSLAALSRTQVGNRINNAYNGASGITPQHFNPVLRLPPIGVRRPVDSSVYDSGFQYNTVSVPNRPFLSTDSNPTSNSFDGNIARCKGSVTYDKIVNVDFVGVRRQEIRSSGDGSPTLECLRECDRLRERCLSVVVMADRFSPDLSRNGTSGTPRIRCYILDRSASADSAALSFTPNSVYYEKTCLPDTGCGKAWTFVRVHGYELDGFDNHVARSIVSKEECQAACMRMPNSQCRSAEYLPREKLCRMSSENRRTQMRSFRATAPDVIYMENQCAGDPPHCEYSDQTGRMLPWYDRVIAIENQQSPTLALAECRRMCDAERDFHCKSVSVSEQRRSPVCLLSADDSVSFSGVNVANVLIPDRDFTYSERSSCNNMRVECTKTDMLVTLAFGYPFNGRVYVNGNYQSCFEMGNGQQQMVLRVPLAGQCGTVQQSRGRYVNHIVVQHSPLIMQDTDSSVRVECAFEASEQTITYSSTGNRRDGSENVGPAGLGSIDVTSPLRQLGHSVVTNTAPTPSLRMRILTRNGQESRVVGLGELLTLRIEIDPSSPFGITARNVEARTDNGEVMTLIDATGCPKDGNVFPPLELDLTTKSLFAEFKAFRFPSTATVNFVATVGFCQERCEPVRCTDGFESYGRRRREANTTTSTSEPEMTTPSQLEVTSQQVTDISSPFETLMTEKVERNTTSETPAGSTEGPAPTTNAAEVTLIPPEDNEIKIPSSTTQEMTTEPMNKPTKTGQNVPVEVPLQLQLIVAPEADRIAILPSALASTNREGYDYDASNRRRPSWRSPSFNQDPSNDDDSLECSSKSTLVAVSVVAVILQAATLVAFYVFYRTKQSSWTKCSDSRKITNTEPVYGIRHSGSVSDVTFRSVYGQKSGPGTLTRAFNLDMNSSTRGPHVASVFTTPDPL